MSYSKQNQTMTVEDLTSLRPINHPKRRLYRTKTFRLLSMLSLTFGYFLVEIIVGNITNSVALVADAFHMLSDVISLVIALVAVRISKRRSDINTYGWVRAEVVGANINTVFLLALCLTIVFDAIRRYITPETIERVNLLLIVGSVGLGINIIGLFLFQGFHGHSHGGSSHGHSHEKKSHGHSHENKAYRHSHEDNSYGHSQDDSSHGHSHHHADTIPKDIVELDAIDEQSEISKKFERFSSRALQEAIAECANIDKQSETVIEMDDDKANKSKKKKASMNMHGVFLHVLADALGSIVVIISALLIKFVPHDPTDVKHWTSYIDPTLSIIIVTIITISTIPLFKETSYILLQTIPRHIEINQIKAQLLENVPEINGIHELHVWRLTNEKIIASAHLNRKNLSNYMSVADKVQKFFHSIGIHSITIQYECECDNDIKSNNQQPSTTTVSYRTNNNPNDENKIAGDCLLRCENDECDTQTCCTKDSDRTSILLNNNNNNNTMEVFAISQPDQNENPLSTQISMNPSVLDEKL